MKVRNAIDRRLAKLDWGPFYTTSISLPSYGLAFWPVLEYSTTYDLPDDFHRFARVTLRWWRWGIGVELWREDPPKPPIGTIE